MSKKQLQFCTSNRREKKFLLPVKDRNIHQRLKTVTIINLLRTLSLVLVNAQFCSVATMLLRTWL